MKNYAKVGNRSGKPAYCTPANFRRNKIVRIGKLKTRTDRRARKRYIDFPTFISK